jgi:hypothetical protein
MDKLVGGEGDPFPSNASDPQITNIPPAPARAADDQTPNADAGFTPICSTMDGVARVSSGARVGVADAVEPYANVVQ